MEKVNSMVNPNKPKRRKCKNCGEWFEPKNIYQVWCDDECKEDLIYEANRQKYEKQMAAAEKKRKREKQKAERKEKRKQVNPRSWWLHKAQAAFNAYIRERDAYKPCVSCGKYNGPWDAGHYRSVAAAGHLRFNEDNCHKQCRHCNQVLDGNIKAYRPELINRIGIERVEALENDNSKHKWTIEECRLIEHEYNEKIIALRRNEVA